jgi:hypothetical protein
MNHLHQLIDALESDNATIPNSVPIEQSEAVVLFTLKKSKQAICFDMGEVELINTIKEVPQLVRLPYPVCWFEGSIFSENRSVLFGALATCLNNEKPTYINAVVFRKTAQSKWSCAGSIRMMPNEKTVSVLISPKESKDTLQVISMWIGHFLSALHCTNIHRHEERPPEALQKARKKRGKQPLFSTWTLDLMLPKQDRDQNHHGGTHASPRLHLRRGHPRQYANGKWIWIKEHVVGNKSLGMVHKDYRAISHHP